MDGDRVGGFDVRLDPYGDVSEFDAPVWDGQALDAVDSVVVSGAMMAVHAAEQLRSVDLMRVGALARAAREGNRLTDVIERSVRLELAAALGVTEYAAGELLAKAEALVHRYPTVLESLHRARFTPRHAYDLVDAVDAVEPELRGQVLAAGLSLAEEHPVGTFRRKLRALVESVRAVTLAERHEEALVRRRVVIEPVDDGMAWLSLFLPAVEAHAIHGRATAMAKVLAKRPDETRTLDQLRADVLGDLLVDGVTDTLPAEARGIRPTVVVTVPALSLLDADVDPEGGFGSVEGVGPIPIGRARELCGSAEGWMRVLTHPETGMVLSVGREKYRPPAGLRRLARWRSETCMAPGCGIPASRCEIDHTIAWEHGGGTGLQNLAPLCKGHHTVKHHGQWRVEQIPGSGGVIRWTSPTGREYRVKPERRTPAFTPSTAHDPPPF